MYGLAAGLSLLALASHAAAIATIEPKGSKLFQNGQQWFIKGDTGVAPVTMGAC